MEKIELETKEKSPIDNSDYTSFKELLKTILDQKKAKEYEQKKTACFDQCNHILIHTSFNSEGLSRCGCIKCGLDNAILDRYKGYDWNNFDIKTQLDDLIMLNYLKSHTLKGRMILPYHCDSKIANEMYNSIQRKHPEIGENETLKYFLKALNNMIHKKSTDKIKLRRAERLRVDHSEIESMHHFGMNNDTSTIDLWIEREANDKECFKGAFMDGICRIDDHLHHPYNYIRVITNCNCQMYTNDENVKINNKHRVIIFYKTYHIIDGKSYCRRERIYHKPVRMLVVNNNTNINACLKDVATQKIPEDKYEETMGHFLEPWWVKIENIDMEEKPLDFPTIFEDEPNICSCHSEELLESYFEGHYRNDKKDDREQEAQPLNYHPFFSLILFLPLRNQKDLHSFEICHTGAYISDDYKIIIPTQTEADIDKKPEDWSFRLAHPMNFN